jgi:hypothetical protein
VETTDKGVVVVQTSNDTETVALLQTHASQVTDLVRGGMAAMHAAMLRNADGRMHGMMGMGHGRGMMHGRTAPGGAGHGVH